LKVAKSSTFDNTGSYSLFCVVFMFTALKQTWFNAVVMLKV